MVQRLGERVLRVPDVLLRGQSAQSMGSPRNATPPRRRGGTYLPRMVHADGGASVGRLAGGPARDVGGDLIHVQEEQLHGKKGWM